MQTFLSFFLFFSFSFHWSTCSSLARLTTQLHFQAAGGDDTDSSDPREGSSYRAQNETASIRQAQQGSDPPAVETPLEGDDEEQSMELASEPEAAEEAEISADDDEYYVDEIVNYFDLDFHPEENVQELDVDEDVDVDVDGYEPEDEPQHEYEDENEDENEHENDRSAAEQMDVNNNHDPAALLMNVPETVDLTPETPIEELFLAKSVNVSWLERQKLWELLLSDGFAEKLLAERSEKKKKIDTYRQKIQGDFRPFYDYSFRHMETSDEVTETGKRSIPRKPFPRNKFQPLWSSAYWSLETVRLHIYIT